MNRYWADGICNACGSVVLEGPSEAYRDYINLCSNPECVNCKAHYCFVDEDLDYYDHNKAPVE